MSEPIWQPTMELRFRKGTIKDLIKPDSALACADSGYILVLEQLWTRAEWTEEICTSMGEHIVPPLFHSAVREWRAVPVVE